MAYVDGRICSEAVRGRNYAFGNTEALNVFRELYGEQAASYNTACQRLARSIQPRGLNAAIAATQGTQREVLTALKARGDAYRQRRGENEARAAADIARINTIIAALRQRAAEAAAARDAAAAERNAMRDAGAASNQGHVQALAAQARAAEVQRAELQQEIAFLSGQQRDILRDLALRSDAHDNILHRLSGVENARMDEDEPEDEPEPAGADALANANLRRAAVITRSLGPPNAENNARAAFLTDPTSAVLYGDESDNGKYVKFGLWRPASDPNFYVQVSVNVRSLERMAATYRRYRLSDNTEVASRVYRRRELAALAGSVLGEDVAQILQAARNGGWSVS